MQIFLGLLLVAGLETGFDIQYFQAPGRYSDAPTVSGWFVKSGNEKISLYPASPDVAELLTKGLDTKKVYSCDAKAYRAPESSAVGVYQSQGQLNRFVFIVYEMRCGTPDK